MNSQVLDQLCQIKNIFPFFLLLILPIQGALGQSSGNRLLVNGSLGESVRLPGIVIQGEADSAIWSFRNSTTGKRNVVCKKLINKVDCDSDVRDRITLDTSDYSIEIQSVRERDQGVYELTVTTTTNVVSDQEVVLRVYERVSRPTIRVTITSSPRLCNVTLSCSVERGSEVMYSWATGGGNKSMTEGHPVIHTGRRLQVSLDFPINSTVYNCTVSNPVSEETQSTDLAKYCIKAVKDDEKPRDHTVSIVVGICIFLACAVSVAICYFMKRRRADKAVIKPRTGDSVVYADIVRPLSPEQSAGHVRELDAIRQQAPGAGLTTIYDEIRFAS